MINSHTETERNLKGSVLPILERLHKEIKNKSKEITNGAGKGLAVLSDSPPDRLLAEADGLAPGAYRLRWQVLAVDGHITRGDIPFQIIAP